MSRVSVRNPLELAEDAHALVQAKPARAHALAERALELAGERNDQEARVAALHALGFARYVLGDPRALSTMRAAVRVAERGGYWRRAGLARRHLALHLAYRGRIKLAKREVDAACAALNGIDRAQSEVFRIAVFHLAGDDVAPADSNRALKVLQRAGDRVWEARLRYNRGAVLAEIGDVSAARRDLERARDLYESLGSVSAVADARLVLARLKLVEGDFVGCLVELDAVDSGDLRDVAAAWAALTRASAFVGLRLLPEARASLDRFVEMSVRTRADDSVNKARLDAARLALLASDSAGAASLAATARRSFASRGQAAFAATASLLSLRAAVGGGSVHVSTLRAARKAAHDLEAAGWTLDALRGRLLVARAAARIRSWQIAEREQALAVPLARRGTVADRIELKYVKALIAIGAGDTIRAERELRAGLRLLDEYRSALGAVELRATVSRIGSELSQGGLRIALDSGEPESVLSWAEQLRANSLRLPPVRPSADRTLRRQQTELRRVAGRIREAEAAGTPKPELVARQVELETAIKARTRRSRGGDGGFEMEVADRRDASRSLGERVLVEYVEVDGVLWVVTLSGGRLSLHELGQTETATELEWLRFALGRLARGGNSPSQRAALLANAANSAEALDNMLVRPLRLGHAPLVVVPTGALHALPWSALPSLRGQTVVVSPSLSLWIDRAALPRSRRRRMTFVAGPGLRHATPEARELAGIYKGALFLHGKAATAEAALAALDGARLAHVACHGRFRADSPLFSSLELADGPLTMLDLQRMRRAPEIMVLSACDLALSDRHPGDELLGLAAVLLAMGTRSIVASVVPVPDAAARRLMLAFHRDLSRGVRPAAALARVQGALQGRSASLAGFVCLGDG